MAPRVLLKMENASSSAYIAVVQGGIEQLGVSLKLQVQHGKAEKVPFLLRQEEKFDVGLKAVLWLPLPALGCGRL